MIREVAVSLTMYRCYDTTAETDLGLAGAWVSNQQQVALSADVCARVIPPGAPADEGDGHSQLDKEHAIDLQQPTKHS